MGKRTGNDTTPLTTNDITVTLRDLVVNAVRMSDRSGADEPAADLSRRSADATSAAAALLGGPAEVLDFLLPLWASAALGASPAQVGAVVALEAGVSLLARPLAGLAADRWDRARVAAVGGLGYALSLAGYAITPTVTGAAVAAAVGGIGGAFFWVGLRARVGEPGSATSATEAYGRLLGAESTGAFLGYLVAFAVLGWWDYRVVFGIGAVSCVVAAGSLLSAPRGAPVPRGTGSLRTVGSRLWPLLALVAVTTVAESGLALVLLLHLQSGLGLGVYEIAMVFAPGFLAFVLLPGHAHRLTDRIGRTTTLVTALLAAAGTPVALAVSGDPVLIALTWAAACCCLAAAIPVEEATVAEVSGPDLGRGMGLYEGAQVAGGFVGPATFGVLYGLAGVGWRLACAAAAVVLVVAAVLAIAAIRALRLGPASPPDAAGVVHDARRIGRPPTGPVDVEAVPLGRQPATSRTEPDLEHARRERERWFAHLGIFALGQGLLWLIGDSWLVAHLRDDVPDDPSWLMTAGRVWITVLIVDLAWSFSYTVSPRRRPAEPE